jgi:hypothetical protein
MENASNGSAQRLGELSPESSDRRRTYTLARNSRQDNANRDVRRFEVWRARRFSCRTGQAAYACA